MDQAAEAAAAAAGGMFSSAALYPLEVIKTNLQAQTKPKKTSPVTSTRSRPFDVETGGESRPSTVNVYTGAEGTAEAEVVMSAAAAGQRSPDIGGISTENGSGREEGKIEAWKEDSAKEEPPSVMSVAREIYSREGILGFYNGTFYASGQSGLEKAAYFYGYGWLKALALRGGGGGGGVGGVERELSAVTDLGLGYLAEAFHLPFTIPIEVVLTKIMTSKDKTNSFAVIQGILAESGPAGFYKGIQAYVVLCLKPAIQYAVFNRLKGVLLAYKAGAGGASRVKELTAMQAFALGAISRAVATVIVFPYIRAKVIIMSRAGAESRGEKTPSILSSLVSILKDEGASALFQGITPEITRGVLSAALMLMVKEKIHGIVKSAILGCKTS